MIKATTWGSDTCECVFRYEWETEQPEAERVHNYTECVQACPAHRELVAPGADLKRHSEQVLGENAAKNAAVAAVMAEDPELKVKWEFDAQRNLVLDVPGSTPVQRARIKAALEAKLGPGRGAVK